MKVTRLVLLVAACLCFLSSSTAARTWHVKAHGTGDAPTIQAAIDSAQNGDTVILANGTYTGEGNRDIDYHGKAITVRSQSNNPSDCIIDCQGSEFDPHRGFYFHTGEDTNSVLQGVTITNGCAPLTEFPVIDDAPELTDSGIWSLARRDSLRNRWSERTHWPATFPSFEATLPLDNGRRTPFDRRVFRSPLRKGVADFPFAAWEKTRLHRDGPSPLDLKVDCTYEQGPGIVGNSPQRCGGAILCRGGWFPMSPTITNCRFVNNLAGAAVYVVEGQPTITNCLFVGNDAGLLTGYWGGGVNVTNCTFSRNSGVGMWCTYVRASGCTFSANSGDGLYVWFGGGTLTDCEFSDNADDGVDSYRTELTFRGCRFSGNRHAGLLGWDESYFYIEDCEFVDNPGSGMLLYDTGVYLTNCTFAGNSNSGVRGVFFGGDFTGCTFSKNSSGSSGAGGLDVAGDYSHLTLRKCTFSDNSGQLGGGMRAETYYDYYFCVVELDNCTFANNSAIYGGAVYSRGCLATLSNCTIYDNSAPWGGGIYCREVQELEEPTSVKLVGCTLYGNTATYGGGIFCQDVRSLTIENTLAAFNKGGGAIFCYENSFSTLDVACCDIYGNVGGDWDRCIKDQYGINGNISSDPLFCNPESGNFALASLSDCLPANSACKELIGAHDEGCSTPTGIASDTHLKADDVALRNSPNPFNPQTRITYTLSTQGFVRLSVYDVAGRLVERLVDAMQPTGEHVVEWKADALPSGIFFCRLEAGGVVETRKLVLLK